MNKICFDTGIFGIFFGKEAPDKQKVLNIFQDSLSGDCEIHVLNAVLSEVFYHLCFIRGTEYARSKIISMINLYPLKQITLNDDLLIKTAQIKCQNRKNFSYIDCMSIAYCILNDIPFHTTEKKIKLIPLPILKKLKIITYQFE